MGPTTFIAFLRAINVGGRIVKMTELKKICERIGLDNVSTFIASGNVIFTAGGKASALEKTLEDGLQAALGYAVRTMVRTAAEVAEVAEYQAYSPAALTRGSLYVGFMQETPAAAAVKKALAMQTAIDELRVHRREVYWLARKNIAESTISMAGVEKALQTPVTFRNINTVRRLAAKYPIA
jgi:uncharacterized protein (DUF1697 family)